MIPKKTFKITKRDGSSLRIKADSYHTANKKDGKSYYQLALQEPEYKVIAEIAVEDVKLIVDEEYLASETSPSREISESGRAGSLNN